MIKLFKASFLILLTACQSAHVYQTSFVTDNETPPATIYVGRGFNFMGGGASSQIKVDEQKCAQIRNGQFIRVQVPAGRHQLITGVEGMGMVDMTKYERTFESGKSYYFKVKASPILIPLAESKGSAFIGSLKELRADGTPQTVSSQPTASDRQQPLPPPPRKKVRESIDPPLGQ